MGEAVYSLLAEFPKPITDEQQKAIKNFFLEGSSAEEYWQNNRGIPGHEQKTKKEFWAEFKTKFPVVSEYLDSIGCLGKDKSNGLANWLDFGTVDDIEDSLKFNGREAGGSEMTYSAEVWHFASWEPLVNFLKTKFGASTAEYLSEEYAPSGVELIKLQRNEGIVQAILNQDKKFLLTLIGIHPSLDAQIEPLLKGAQKRKGIT